MKQKSPVRRIWELGKDEHGRLIAAVVLAVVGAVCGMAPYYAAARIITLLLAGTATLQSCAVWLIVALCGYLLRTALYNGALGVSHRATFSILKTIRQLLLAKLPRLPLGTVMDTASGKLKQTIQGAKTMSLPMQMLCADLQAHKVIYNNNPVLKWCLTNTGVQTDRNGNIVPIKNQSPKQRIDGTAALLDCYVGLYEHYTDYATAI